MPRCSWTSHDGGAADSGLACAEQPAPKASALESSARWRVNSASVATSTAASTVASEFVKSSMGLEDGESRDERDGDQP